MDCIFIHFKTDKGLSDREREREGGGEEKIYRGGYLNTLAKHKKLINNHLIHKKKEEGLKGRMLFFRQRWIYVQIMSQKKIKKKKDKHKFTNLQRKHNTKRLNQ